MKTSSPMPNKPMVARLTSNLRRKVFLSIVLTVYFYLFYGLLQRYPIFPVTNMGQTWLDRMIPFVPGFVPLYLSITILVPIGPWLIDSWEDLRRYGLGLTCMSLAGFLVFFLYPTACPRPVMASDVNALYRGLVGLDRELNSFPSLHAALAVFSGAWCHHVFGLYRKAWLIQSIVWLWVGGILASTLLTKQHVIVDILAGGILGGAAYRLLPGRKARKSASVSLTKWEVK